MKRITESDILIGKNIAVIRTSKGLNRKKLADMVGVTHQQMSKYENAENRVSAAMIIKIAHALECSCDYILRQEYEGNKEGYDKSCICMAEIYSQLGAKERNVIYGLAKILFNKEVN